MELLNKKERANIRKKYQGVVFPDPILEPLWFGRRPEKMIDSKSVFDSAYNKLAI